MEFGLGSFGRLGDRPRGMKALLLDGTSGLSCIKDVGSFDSAIIAGAFEDSWVCRDSG